MFVHIPDLFDSSFFLCPTGDVTQYQVTHYQVLLEHGADANVTDNWGTTALMFAAGLGRVKYVRLLLEHGAAPNTQVEDGSTALMRASEYGYCNVVQSLLEHGADPTISCSNGDTALTLAARHGHASVIRVILEHMARIAMVCFLRDREVYGVCAGGLCGLRAKRAKRAKRALDTILKALDVATRHAQGSCMLLLTNFCTL